MSESLYQAQQIQELQHTAILSGIPSEHVKDMIYEDYKTTLQNFGFTTNKPLNNVTSRKSKKSNNIYKIIVKITYFLNIVSFI
jgi:hypothetical protein